MVWSHLVKFVNDQGQLHHGEPLIDYAEDLCHNLQAGTQLARELVGKDLVLASTTDKILKVAKLLGPLDPQDVPILRCVCLNYATHSELYASLPFFKHNFRPGWRLQ
jgi:hypothetical protein